jgi:hypothetical protein
LRPINQGGKAMSLTRRIDMIALFAAFGFVSAVIVGLF